MPAVSGRVVFDRDRSASISPGDSGIAGIPVVLQNISSGLRLTVLTDGNGNYSFINVPDGDYRIVESFGTAGGVPTPGDFNDATVGTIPPGVVPTLSFVPNPPSGTTNLDSVTPNTLLVTVSGALQEAALARILDAEGEKIQTFIAMDDVTNEQLFAVNNSVTSLVGTISMFENVLHAKLQDAASQLNSCFNE